MATKFLKGGEILSREEYPELYAAIAKAFGPLPGKDFQLPMMHAVPDDPNHPELGMHAEEMLSMDEPDRNSVTKTEAQEFLDQCKMAYRKAVTEATNTNAINQFRFEIRYWEDYLHANWAEERAKRDPQTLGGGIHPLSKQDLTEIMDHVYERLKKVHEIEGFGLSSESRVIAEIYGTLKTLAGVMDELIRTLK